ncbi:hypothetical protein BDBG_03099 [Blastomyces gilchristii SLH14081]|uniref:Uncharacterized protein n=1 Tax=Blastomyces gilchristii (strain SLH14081) TaxID=559298 RepID=A0A179UIL5_BLAGS|nr:uncharacterized protein BDBG_03099 [Blastomyces gilchristii SLH14081]OAT06977.1 hypothetical protein BDBG_03099 [Blastomyces gilchristii SLH14081]
MGPNVKFMVPAASLAAPDQSYRLFRYTPQIPRTLRSSAILDCRSSAILDRRSSAATPINHIDYSVTLHRLHVRSDPRPFSIADPRPLRTNDYPLRDIRTRNDASLLASRPGPATRSYEESKILQKRTSAKDLRVLTPRHMRYSYDYTSSDSTDIIHLTIDITMSNNNMEPSNSNMSIDAVPQWLRAMLELQQQQIADMHATQQRQYEEIQ